MNNNAQDDDNSCIICLEEEGELLENFFCACKFNFHTKCYKDWLIKSCSRKCLVCYSDYTEEAIVDFLGNLRLDNSVDVSFTTLYDTVPYENDDESTNNSGNRNNDCNIYIIILVGIMVICIIAFIVLTAASISSSGRP